jgi:hypothetical protein
MLTHLAQFSYTSADMLVQYEVQTVYRTSARDVLDDASGDGQADIGRMHAETADQTGDASHVDRSSVSTSWFGGIVGNLSAA